MGCNKKDLVLVCSEELKALQSRLANQETTIADLQCQLNQLISKSNSTQAKRILKKAKTKCSTEPNCGCP